jgi:hypothetical protein
MPGVRKPVENHLAEVTGEGLCVVVFHRLPQPWETRQTPPSFPHSHSPDEGGNGQTISAPAACRTTRSVRPDSDRPDASGVERRTEQNIDDIDSSHDLNRRH